MSQHDKLLKRFLSKPKDFTYREIKTLLNHFGYQEVQGAGSRSSFHHTELDGCPPVEIHKPHGGKAVLKTYQLKQIENNLRQEGFIE